MYFYRIVRYLRRVIMYDPAESLFTKYVKIGAVVALYWYVLITNNHFSFEIPWISALKISPND